MEYLQAALAVSATMFCYTGSAEEEAAESQAMILGEICQQIVRDVNREMAQKVAACIPAACV